MLLVVDNGSVYTKNLIEFLQKIKAEFTSLPFDKVTNSEISSSSSFILSGRRKNDKTMNALNSQIVKHAISEKKPLLGICYGAEILALSIGGTIKKTKSPLKGTEQIIILKENQLCQGIIDVFESHHYEISSLSNNFSILGKSENCQREIIQYKDQKIFGTQFHPEMSKDGQELIQKFYSINS